MELSTTTGKLVVDVTFAVEDEKDNSIAVVVCDNYIATGLHLFA